MTQAEQWTSLWRREQKRRQITDLIARGDYEDKYGVSIETIRLETEPLDLDNGFGFITRIKFMDGSEIESKEMYLTVGSGEDEHIVFERRGAGPQQIQ